MASMLSENSEERKKTPIYSGVLAYFPLAIAEVARVSWAGNEKHNPGEPLHWAREKSKDHTDCIARHLLEVGTTGSDGIRHSAALAWRALANLELELEAEQPKDVRKDYQILNEKTNVIRRVTAGPGDIISLDKNEVVVHVPRLS